MINHNKAYILGLFVGNGTISKDTFIIKLPFKKWGMQPELMNKIATDILTKICNKFQVSYSFAVSYEIGNSEWTIKPISNPNISELKKDLADLGLPTTGFLLNSSNLEVAKEKLQGIQLEIFLSGIFDTRASLTKSHRRFTDDAPIVSLEIPGSTKNFDFVIAICSWLTQLGTTTDQILFNHPCQHSASDPTYKGWKKGFKIRFLVNSFLAQHSFALQAKAIDVEQLKLAQIKNEQIPCIERKLRKPSPVSIHQDINSNSLPQNLRNKLFFHYHHYCAVLGCPFAPLKEIEKLVVDYKNYIFALPRLEKGTNTEIKQSFQNLAQTHFSDKKILSRIQTVQELLSEREIKKYLDLEQGVAFLLSDTLNGKRHIGSKEIILQSNMNTSLKIWFVSETHLSPLLIENKANNRSVLVSALKSEINQKLIDKHIKIKGLEVIIK